MKKIVLSLFVVTMLILSSCDFGPITGGWNNDNTETISIADLVEAELLAEADVDVAIEEDIEISIPTSFSKAAPGPYGQGNRRRIHLRVKQEIDSVDVSYETEYVGEDTALVTLSKTLFGTMFIRNTDTTITDTPVVWEKSYEYTTVSYMQFIKCICADSSSDSSNDSTSWKLYAKSIETGETSGIMNTLESVTVVGESDSIETLFDDPTELYAVVKGNVGQGHFRGRPANMSTNVFAQIYGTDDVNVLGSTGRYFALEDDGTGIDLTADDNIYSGTVLQGRGQSRLRVRMITTATFIEEDAPVEIATWFLPIR